MFYTDLPGAPPLITWLQSNLRATTPSDADSGTDRPPSSASASPSPQPDTLPLATRQLPARSAKTLNTLKRSVRDADLSDDDIAGKKTRGAEQTSAKAVKADASGDEDADNWSSDVKTDPGDASGPSSEDEGPSGRPHQNVSPFLNDL
jgi:hypothetical protein